MTVGILGIQLRIHCKFLSWHVLSVVKNMEFNVIEIGGFPSIEMAAVDL